MMAFFYIIGLLLALNRVREHAFQVSLPVPEGTKSGDPLIIGSIPCVALIDEGKDTEGEATVAMVGSWEFEVTGKKGEEEKAIKPGEPVYLKEGTLSADSGGTLFGYALQEVAKGKTSVIEVKLATT